MLQLHRRLADMLSFAWCSSPNILLQSGVQVLQGVDKIVEQSPREFVQTIRNAQEDLERVAAYFLDSWPREVSEASQQAKFDKLETYVRKFDIEVLPALYHSNCSDGRMWPSFMLAAGLQIQTVQEDCKFHQHIS